VIDQVNGLGGTLGNTYATGLAHNRLDEGGVVFLVHGNGPVRTTAITSQTKSTLGYIDLGELCWGACGRIFQKKVGVLGSSGAVV
jgi:hypothetical protein